MRILFLWDYQEAYLQQFWRRNPVQGLSSNERASALFADSYGWIASLLPALRARGHDASMIVGNALPIQQAWAAENDVSYDRFQTVLDQIKVYRPDVLWLGLGPQYTDGFLQDVRQVCPVVVGWGAYHGVERLDLAGVDHILTSHPSFREHFRRMNIPSTLFFPCFDCSILERLPRTDQMRDVLFYGGLQPSSFSTRIELLAYLAKRTKLDIAAAWPVFGHDPRSLRFLRSRARLASIRRHSRSLGSHFGLDLYGLISSSTIILNAHVDASRGMAGNMRIFEVVGCGSLLLTEEAPNLSDLLIPGREVVTYASPSEALEKIDTLLGNDDKRRSIAAAGQARVLTEHNPSQRAVQFLEVVMPLFANRDRSG